MALLSGLGLTTGCSSFIVSQMVEAPVSGGHADPALLVKVPDVQPQSVQHLLDELLGDRDIGHDGITHETLLSMVWVDVGAQGLRPRGQPGSVSRPTLVMDDNPEESTTPVRRHSGVMRGSR